MRRIIRYLSVSLGLAAFLFAFAPQTAEAAKVRLTPQHMYQWAHENNSPRLKQFQRYINMMDENKNTALCLAQQAQDKQAYSLLLDYGASTKAPCHDDNDPICAIVAGEKVKVHPAAWALLAAGAAAGAYVLLDDDDDDGDDSPKPCTPPSVNKGTCAAPDTYHRLTEVETGEQSGDKKCVNCNYTCATGYFANEASCTNGSYTCTPHEQGGTTCWERGEGVSCPSGYSTDYQSVANCGPTGIEGWIYTSSGFSGDLKCGKCTPLTCPEGTNTDWDPYTECPNVDGLTATDNNQDHANGNLPCYRCIYECNESTAFADKGDCEDMTSSTCTSVAIPINNGTGSKSCYTPNGVIPTSVRTTPIIKTSSGSEDVVGISGEETLVNGGAADLGTAQQSSTNTNGNAEITINHNSTGNAYGMKGLTNNILINDKTGSIIIHNNATGKAYGMYAATGGSATNRGVISITGNTGTAYGIYGEGQNDIDNSGTINVSGKDAYGIYVKDGQGSTINNSGTINVNADGEAHGIYVDKNSANAVVSNTGTIFINNEERPNDTGITLNGAEMRNFSVMRFSRYADLNRFGGKVYIEKGGVYEAQSLKGDLNVGVSNVLGGNKDTYVAESAVQAEDVSDLNVNSESILFDATLEKNADGKGYNIKQNFLGYSKITPNTSVTKYLEQNRKEGYLENTLDTITSAVGNEAATAAKKLGYDIMPNFADENFTVLKSLNRNIANMLLVPTDEENRVVAGADSINWETDTKGLLSGSDLSANTVYTFGDKRLDNKNRLGLGLSFTELSSNYDLGGDRDLSIVSVFIPYIHKFTDKLRLATVATVGYGYGEYERGNDNKSDITNYFYGLTNELRYTIDLNGFAQLEPALMLNAIGYHDDGYDEGNGADALETKSTNNHSIEAGVGLFLKKDVKTEKYGKFGFKIGGVYYRELGSPYKDIDARMKRGNAMWYRINDYANLYSHDRAIIEAAIDYEYKRIGVYLKYNRLIQKNDPELFDLGIKYNF